MVCSSRTYSSFELANLLPWPHEDAHKYSRGRLVLVAGSARYPGAAVLAARAAQRMGAGYVEVACAPETVSLVLLSQPSLVAHSWDELKGEANALPAHRPGKPVAYVVGPGFDGNDRACRHLARHVLAAADAPVLVDGGGLVSLCSDKGRAILHERAERGLATVITPHAGEAANLARAADLSPERLSPSDLSVVLALAYHVVCVLKGPNTFVSDGETVSVMTEGTPALAKAGTGDVLAGMAGALLAQGCDPLDAAMMAATLHARAGVEASKRYTQIGVTAEDVIEGIPAVLASLKRR